MTDPDTKPFSPVCPDCGDKMRQFAHSVPGGKWEWKCLRCSPILAPKPTPTDAELQASQKLLRRAFAAMVEYGRLDAVLARWTKPEEHLHDICREMARAADAAEAEKGNPKP